MTVSYTHLDVYKRQTQWLAHTARAALTGLRKRGHVVELRRGEGNRTAYHADVRS